MSKPRRRVTTPDPDYVPSEPEDLLGVSVLPTVRPPLDRHRNSAIREDEALLSERIENLAPTENNQIVFVVNDERHSPKLPSSAKQRRRTKKTEKLSSTPQTVTPQSIATEPQVPPAREPTSGKTLLLRLWERSERFVTIAVLFLIAAGFSYALSALFHLNSPADTSVHVVKPDRTDTKLLKLTKQEAQRLRKEADKQIEEMHKEVSRLVSKIESLEKLSQGEKRSPDNSKHSERLEDRITLLQHSVNSLLATLGYPKINFSSDSDDLQALLPFLNPPSHPFVSTPLLNVAVTSAGARVVSWSDLFDYRRVAKEELVFNHSDSTKSVHSSLSDSPDTRNCSDDRYPVIRREMRPKHIWTQITSRGRKREEARTAQVILDPSLELGSCLPLAIHQNKSSPAFVTIDLLRKFNVQAVSLSHSPSSSALLQSRLSAPAHFQVFCDDKIASNSSHVDLSSNHSPNQTRFFLGEGHYDFGKTTKQNTTQTFYMTKSSHEDTYQPCRHVRVELLSNHGDLDFVCLYNVQVHPDLTKE
ncbi:hypothetical protein BLNAU_14743 [Blattamonas nauphoetae]|uniref:SUN domain-containing protein n=1 Tax=Blattamonas nauphoetae TaxID=2049346 RepID=A0ABQ9XCU3_9EUKA|nr:hypothetical protein BLNAU_14743 [Blattamonas nauphoetae]